MASQSNASTYEGAPFRRTTRRLRKALTTLGISAILVVGLAVMSMFAMIGALAVPLLSLPFVMAFLGGVY